MDNNNLQIDWNWVWAVIIVPILASLGVLGRKVWSGTAYYLHEGWLLLNKLADKHISFVDTVQFEQTKQTELLGQIAQTTSKTAAKIEKWDSDPLKHMEEKKDQWIEEAINKVIAKAREHGWTCTYEKAEAIVAGKLKARHSDG